MPEGHILHRLARDLRALQGHSVAASSPQGRFPAADLLDGHRLEEASAHGKHLFLRFRPGVVHVHLGIQGKFLRLELPPPPRPQVRLRLATPAVAWDLIAPARCELLGDDGVAGLLAGLGPDPLRPEADPEVAWQRLPRHGRPVGAALLDQSVIAGVGNVFRAEALHLTGVAPDRPVGELSRTEFDALWQTLRSIMKAAVDEGRIVTVDTPGVAEADGRYVYKQGRCRRCATPVAVASIGGREAYWCPRCQA